MKSVFRSLIAAGALALAVLGPLAGLSSSAAHATSLSDIQKRGKVRIGVLTGAPPMGMVDDRGNPTGYDVDVANLVGTMFNLPVELVPLTPPARIPALQAGQVDFLVATLSPTGERAKTVMFTSPYSAFNMVVVSGPGKVFNSLEELKGKRISVNRGSSQETALRRANVPGLELVVYEDDSTSAQALLSGQVDGTAIPSTVANALVKQMPNAGLQVGKPFFRQGNSMATLPGDSELLQYLNTLIYLMKVSGQLDAIATKWTGEPFPTSLPTF